MNAGQILSLNHAQEDLCIVTWGTDKCWIGIRVDMMLMLAAISIPDFTNQGRSGCIDFIQSAEPRYHHRCYCVSRFCQIGCQQIMHMHIGDAEEPSRRTHGIEQGTYEIEYSTKTPGSYLFPVRSQSAQEGIEIRSVKKSDGVCLQ